MEGGFSKNSCARTPHAAPPRRIRSVEYPTVPRVPLVQRQPPLFGDGGEGRKLNRMGSLSYREFPKCSQLTSTQSSNCVIHRAALTAHTSRSFRV